MKVDGYISRQNRPSLFWLCLPKKEEGKGGTCIGLMLGHYQVSRKSRMTITIVDLRNKRKRKQYAGEFVLGRLEAGERGYVYKMYIFF
ncbi:hypothetical protein Leryth_001853 [Lithospermum erythrorhizon]|nr:hypothetical protein Leryth_001853 [Lithospermum erythrorhizon]